MYKFIPIKSCLMNTVPIKKVQLSEEPQTEVHKKGLPQKRKTRTK